MSAITFGLCSAGFLWYRRKYLKLSWREVFFLDKEDNEGKDLEVNLEDDDDYGSNGRITPAAITKKTKGRGQTPQVINIDEDEQYDARVP